jgi:hypothetical protein
MHVGPGDLAVGKLLRRPGADRRMPRLPAQETWCVPTDWMKFGLPLVAAFVLQ